MSYNLSETNKSGKLLQPVNIAVLASIGIHAIVLGVALPNFSSFSAPSNSLDSRTVNVVELSAIEQSRLPDLSNTMVDLGTAATMPNTSPPPPPTDNSLSFNIPFPNLNTLPPPPSLPPLPLNGVSTAAYFPQLPSLPPPPPASISIPSLPYQTQNIPFPSVRAPIFTEPEMRVSFPTPPPPMNIRDLINQKPTDSPAELPLQAPTVMANSQGINPQDNQQSMSNQVAILQQQREEALRAAIQERARSLQHDGSNTTDEEARKNYVNWAVAVKNDKPEILSIAGIYPKDACMRRLSGSAVYGVLANAQGRASNVDLIKSTGYPILNQQGMAQINSLSFPNSTGNAKAYRVNVSFNYNEQVCPSSGNSPTIEATKSSPNPENLPENTPPDSEETKTPTPAPTPVEARQPPAPPEETPKESTPVEARKTPVTPEETPKESTPIAPVKVPENPDVLPTAPAAPAKTETPNDTEINN